MEAKKFRTKLLRALQKKHKRVEVEITVTYDKMGVRVRYFIWTSDCTGYSLDSLTGQHVSGNLVKSINKCLPEINDYFKIKLRPLKN